jgi:hypothetical protein
MNTILDSIYEYKKILKRHLPVNQYSKKIKQLGIKNKQLKNMNEVALYHLASNIIKDLEKLQSSNDYLTIRYSGTSNFIKHLKSTLQTHYLENSKLINGTQKAAHAMVEAIQLLAFGDTDDMLYKKIQKCTQDIAKYGSKQQMQKFSEALKHPHHRSKNFVPGLVRYLDKAVNTIQEAM